MEVPEIAFSDKKMAGNSTRSYRQAEALKNS